MANSCKDLILAQDRPVPRYTSYPTAPHFKPGFDVLSYGRWLDSVPAQARLSLYLHVPFCTRLCHYCGCHTKITQRYAPIEDYAHLLMREVRMLAAFLKPSQRVTHIHFGGGSPTSLRADDFAAIMDVLRANVHVQEDAEIAMEMDPRGLTEGRVAAYAAKRLSRASLGVQDFDETVLHAINRPQPFHQSYEAVHLLRSYGIDNINLDLLYGLPHQSLQSMTRTVDLALTLKPDRISLFGYAHVPWMKKHMRLIPTETLPDASLRFDLFELAAERLIAAGYVKIGIDHFAIPEDSLVLAQRQGKLRRNFQGYTCDTADVLLGLGASSIGHLQQGYVQNAIAMPEYRECLLNGFLPVKKFYALSQEDRLRSAVIERLMCDFEADIAQMCRAYDFPPNHLDESTKILQQWEAEGFVQIPSPVHVKINPQGRPLTRLICAAYDAYLPQAEISQPRHAQAI